LALLIPNSGEVKCVQITVIDFWWSNPYCKGISYGSGYGLVKLWSTWLQSSTKTIILSQKGIYFHKAKLMNYAAYKEQYV